MISGRQNEIVKAIVKEYIRTAQPVSSGFLAEKYDFGICPSAIRIELQWLLKEGFLEQPHTSSGKIPTDKAYRLFVDSLPEKDSEKIEKYLQDIIDRREDAIKKASNIAKILADLSSSLIVLHLFGEDITLKEGLDEIFKNPESSDKEFVSEFVSLLENFEKNIGKINSAEGIKIFIGEELPVMRMKNITVICSECNLPSERGFISIIGPKRMNYDKNIAIINSLNKVLDEII